ncbi:hypothetical protein PR048_018408 [Dryococelus australis]|uniref:Hexosyltransferase n=1 Tax=Dryococelus australis TaxID=614101 RepID=A0ABQ9HC73_9NEOP|nr:hypothetical protein PR048_018408 [Dryococelus australis]
MAVNYRWLRYVLGGLAVVVIVYLEIMASSETGVGEPLSSLQQSPLLENDTTSSVQDTTQASTTTVANDTATTTVPPTGASKYILKYMNRPGFVIENPGLCRGNGSLLRVVILVTSAPDHERHRMAIRYTWGHFSTRRDVVIAFFLGAVESITRQKALQEESDMYGDMIQSQNVDRYRRLPLKTLSLLQWVDEHCPGARFVLKTDDDMFINVPELLRFVEERDAARNTIFGQLARGWKPNRSLDSKYRVSRDELPGSVLPDFTTGPAYLMTGDVVRRMYLAALDRRFVPLEDVLFTGLIARDLGINKVHSSKFHPGFGNSKAEDCRRKASISIHDVRYEQQFVFWSRLLDGTLKC